MIADLDRVHAHLTKTDFLQEEPDARVAQVEAVFRLSPFERDLLLWCAGAEVDGRFETPTFGAALSALDGGHWDALAPAAPLRHWRLIEVGAGSALVNRPLRIDERVLHHLIGVTCLDPRLDGVLEVRPEAGPSEADDAFGEAKGVVLLVGGDEEARQRAAGSMAAAQGRLLLVLPHDRLPQPGPDNAFLARLVEREVALLGGLLFIPSADVAPGLNAFVRELGCTVVIGGYAPGVPVDERRIVPGGGSAQLSELADRIEPYAGWADLVLPEPSVQALRELAGQVRHRTTVYADWGMGGPRGQGITALFTGESGTGKTLAAEVLAAELGLDLYRIDLASVVSKYIGETEKNLKRVFDAAESSDAVLLFDEADAIFGRRSEVRDSHDRYANLEISYLLQRMETYRGLAVLTTNLRGALDRSFMRRLRFVVPFPFPDAAARARIWRLMLPPRVPVSDLDFERLARLQLSGGNIRTVALNAAFLAADAGGPVSMAHLLSAARREYAKLEKPLTEAEIGGWA